RRRCCTSWRTIANSRASARASLCAALVGSGRSLNFNPLLHERTSAMILLLGAFTIGLILSLLAFGVYLSFRVFNFPDITAEGSITLGAALSATLLVRGWGPAPATAVGFAGGLVAGAMTGLLHTKCRINGLLSGILVMTALYSINLH